MGESNRDGDMVTAAAPEQPHPYLAPDIDPEDIPPLWLLRSRLPVLEAFITLFRGSLSDSLVRLLVLGEMGRRGAAPEWTLAELRRTFAYLASASLETALRRLRTGSLLRYDASQSLYVLTPAGLRVYGAVASLLQLTEEDDLGWITSVVRASYELGTLSPEVLSHLLYRLRCLETQLEQAVESLSEPRILQARERLRTVWAWIERGSAMILQILQDSGLDRELHRVAQQIGRAQSRLLRMTTIFQRVHNDIDRQRVHLGATGLSTSDLVFFLGQCTLEELRTLIAPHLAHPIRPLFVLTDLLTDQAEYELLRRRRRVAEWCALPQPLGSPSSQPPASVEVAELDRLVDHLQTEARRVIPLAEVVPWGSFEESAYRLSMVSLLGDTDSAEGDGPVGKLAALPFTMAALPTDVAVGRAGVATISAGYLHRLPIAPPVGPPPLKELHLTSVSSPLVEEDEGGGYQTVDIPPCQPPPTRGESFRVNREPSYAPGR